MRTWSDSSPPSSLEQGCEWRMEGARCSSLKDSHDSCTEPEQVSNSVAKFERVTRELKNEEGNMQIRLLSFSLHCSLVRNGTIHHPFPPRPRYSSPKVLIVHHRTQRARTKRRPLPRTRLNPHSHDRTITSRRFSS